MHDLFRKIVLFALTLSLLAPAQVYAQEALQGAAEEERKDPPNLSTTRLGETGLFRVISGYTPWKKRFSIGTGLQYWQQDDFIGPNYFHKHLETIGHVTISPTDWLEVFVGGISRSHQYRDELIKGSPQLVQSIGDLNLGTKFGFEANEFFYLGADWFVQFNTQQGNLGPAFSATSFGLRLLPTFDLTGLADPIPFRFLLNFGYERNNTANVVEAQEGGGSGIGSSHLQYSLAIPPDNDVFIGGVGIEIPQKYLSIILEYTTEQYKDLDGSVDRGESQARVYNTSPQRLTPGVRFFPVGGLVVDLYADLGAGLLGFSDGAVPLNSLTDQKEEIMPDWTANLGLTYNFTPPPPPAPKEGRVRGLVNDAKTGMPVGDVVIRFPGRNVTDLITDETGKFTSYAFVGGEIEVTAKKENYQPATAKVNVLPGKEVALNLKLDPIEKIGMFAGKVQDEKGKPVLASVSFEGTNLPNVATDPMTGMFEVKLPPDVYTVKVIANGFNPDTKRIRVVNRRKTSVVFQLKAKETFGTLLGKIEAADGKPVAGVVSFSDPKVRPIASHPDTGQYEDKVIPGTYTVKASAAGFEPATQQVVIESGRTSMVNFVLSPVVTSGTLEGVVVDAKSGNGLYAVISSPNGEFSNIVADPESGRFIQKLPAGEYLVKAAAPNYKAEQKPVQIVNGQNTQVRFELQGFDKIAVTREAIEIKEKIRFAQGKDTILFDSYPLLDEISDAIKDNTKMQISIEGHTDSQGSDDYNLRLSQRRADAVRDYLIARGVPAENLKSIGFGESRPIAPNDTEEGREKNRRVEFRILAQ